MFLLTSSCHRPLLSDGAGLDNQAALRRHRTRFSEFWAGFGVVPAFFSSCRPPPAQCRAVVWVIRSLYCGTGLSIFRVRFFFVLPFPPPVWVGGGLGIFCHSDCGTGLCGFCFLLFGGIISPRPPSLRSRRYFVFSLFRRHIHSRPAPPLSGDMAVDFLGAFPVPYG